MVRGRRTRRAATSVATTTTMTASSATNGGGIGAMTTNGSLAPQSVLKMVSNGDDFSCASPKRKEYKIDELLLRSANSSNGFTNGCSAASAAAAKTHMVLRGGTQPASGAQNQQPNSCANVTGSTNGRALCSGAGNGITRFLLNQAKSKSRKTRKKSPNFELVNDDTCDSFTHATSLQEAPELNGATTTTVKMETMDEEEVVMVVKSEDEEEVELNGHGSEGEEAKNAFPFQMFGRLPLGGSETAEGNIFLQEPVLKLTVDEAACVLVQRKRNGEVVESGGKKGVSGGGAAAGGEQVSSVVGGGVSSVAAAAAVALINQDSNSGDSGVVIDKLQEALMASISPKASPLLAVAARQRKPTTPHRILCPSSPQVNGIKEEAGMAEGAGSGGGEEMENGVQMTKRKLLLPTKDNAPQSENGMLVENGYGGQHDDQPRPVKAESTKNGGCAKATTTTNGHHHHQSTMEDFFKVRRSVRKTKKEVEREEQLAIEKAILAAKDTDLAVKLFDNKGRGIVGTRPFAKGEFVVEYVGEFISIAEANKREKVYAEDQSTGCYMYYFKHRNKQYCIDATEETGKLGRLVNHSRNGNLMTRTVEVKGQPHLVLIAKEDIEAGRELTYDYGDRSKESLLHHPWLAY